MRYLFTTQEAAGRGLTPDALRWGEQAGRWRRVERGVYVVGPEDPTALDRARAALLKTGGVACGTFAGVLHRLDGVHFDGPHLTLPRDRNGRRPGSRRRELAPERVVEVHGVRCTDGVQTLVDLAAMLDDLVWEQALESALRRRLTSVEQLLDALPELGRSRTPGTARIRRVLELRPPGAPPTESLLETLMVQLVRTVPGLPDPVRQYEVYDARGRFVARLDVSWPEPGLFLELDGQQHEGQPAYDARRQTAVVAVTGWLPGRFTWREVVRHPAATRRRVAELAAAAWARPQADGLAAAPWPSGSQR